MRRYKCTQSFKIDMFTQVVKMQLVLRYIHMMAFIVRFFAHFYLLFPRKNRNEVKIESLFSFIYWLRSVKFTRIFAGASCILMRIRYTWNARIAHKTTMSGDENGVCIVIRWNDISAAAAM